MADWNMGRTDVLRLLTRSETKNQRSTLLETYISRWMRQGIYLLDHQHQYAIIDTMGALFALKTDRESKIEPAIMQRYISFKPNGSNVLFSLLKETYTESEPTFGQLFTINMLIDPTTAEVLPQSPNTTYFLHYGRGEFSLPYYKRSAVVDSYLVGENGDCVYNFQNEFIRKEFTALELGKLQFFPRS